MRKPIYRRYYKALNRMIAVTTPRDGDMQFTGHLDMENKPVFEGDIVVRAREYGGFDPPKVVRWRECRSMTGFNIGSCHNKKVVGNIYMNPKLIP